MGPTDPRLLLLAKEAKVRPHHVFWTWHAIAADPAAFDPAAAALFCQLEQRHIEAIIAALRQNDLMPQPKGRNRRARDAVAAERATRLPPDFQVPLEWIRWAQVERGWTQDVAETVAKTFVNHWLSKGGKDACKVNWERTFHNWITNDRRPNGEYVGRDAPALTPDEKRARLAEQAAFRVRVGRE